MRKQCKKCPWRKGVDPREIPDGYCERQHRALAATIARPGVLSPLRMMACHETPIGKENPCIGWLANQLGPGNNIPLRLAAHNGLIEEFRTVGEQHLSFEDTLP